MKSLLAIAIGFVTTLAVFGSGIALAMFVMMPAPEGRPNAGGEDVASVWTSIPRQVERGAQGLERIAAVLPAGVSPVNAAEADEADDMIAGETGAPVSVSSMTTAALPAEEDPITDDDVQMLMDAHVAWCHERYRSYREADNSYQPYSGGRRDCVSPHLGDLTFADGAAEAVNVAGYVADDGAGSPAGDPWRELGLVDMSPAHVDDCLRRYRSYRVEDNSYQPYGGGPRRQCE